MDQNKSNTQQSPNTGDLSTSSLAQTGVSSKKLTSEHIKEKTVEIDENDLVGPKPYNAYMRRRSGGITGKNLQKLGADGVVKEGATVETGDILVPVVTSASMKNDKEVTQNLKKLFKNMNLSAKDRSLRWEEPYDGKVVRVVNTPTVIRVYIKSEESFKTGDKLSGSHGQKGIVSAILPDDEVPHMTNPATGEREPVDLMVDPHGVSGYDPQTEMLTQRGWIAMTDTDAENGGLCIVPGSHQEGLMETEKNEDMEEHDSWEVDYLMRDRDGKEWTQHMYSYDIQGLDPGEVVQLTVPKGAGVFFSGFTVHGSYANRSKDRVRRAFATHYVADDVWVYRADVQDLTPAT